MADGDLTAHDWLTTYASDQMDLVRGFYEPALSLSDRYWRAVGYFSSRALAVISPGIQTFYANNGKMRLVASPALNPKDLAALNEGYRNRRPLADDKSRRIVAERLAEYLDPARLESEEEHLRLRLLSGMIQDRLLEVRIAVRAHDDGTLGLYHEKIGMFQDQAQHYITFIGSPNESWNGWVGNAESFALHTSWNDSRHARSERKLFTETWNQDRPGVPTFTLPQAAQARLFELFPPMDPDEYERTKQLRVPAPPGVAPGQDVEAGLGLRIPDWLERNGLHGYQREAINRWEGHGHRGTFAMATGTGKTVMALVAAKEFAERLAADERRSTLVVVVVPQSLASQWARNATEFAFRRVVCHGAAGRWEDPLTDALSTLSGPQPRAEMCIVSADTLRSDRFSSFRDWIRSGSFGLVVVGDEVHSLGTEARLAALPERDGADVGRMGLSATPRRHRDEHGTRRLLEYFGPIRYRIGIKRAISLGALSPYRYSPDVVRLDEDEQELFDQYTAEIAKAWQAAGNDDERFYRTAGPVLSKRVALLGHARNKTQRGVSAVTDGPRAGYELLYVAEGAHPLTGTVQRRIALDRVRESGLRANDYIHTTDDDQRENNLDMFRRGELDVLVAMRCLDEGVDIPEARRGVILASTQNPRQFVQRRGRLLRTHPSKEDSGAEIVDLLVLPLRRPDGAAFAAERNLVRRELSRALELAEASTNGAVAPPAALRQVMAEYDLVDLTATYGEDDHWDDDVEVPA